MALGTKLRRFAHAYYVLNVLVLASYLPLRRHLAEPAAVEGTHAQLPKYVRDSAVRPAARTLAALAPRAHPTRVAPKCGRRGCSLDAATLGVPRSLRVLVQERQAVLMLACGFCMKARRAVAAVVRRLQQKALLHAPLHMCAHPDGCHLRCSRTVQVLRVHCAEHLVSLMFSYAKVRRRRAEAAAPPLPALRLHGPSAASPADAFHRVVVHRVADDVEHRACGGCLCVAHAAPLAAALALRTWPDSRSRSCMRGRRVAAHRAAAVVRRLGARGGAHARRGGDARALRHARRGRPLLLGGAAVRVMAPELRALRARLRRAGRRLQRRAREAGLRRARPGALAGLGQQVRHGPEWCAACRIDVDARAHVRSSKTGVSVCTP